MSTYIPVTTLSNFRDNFVPPSLSDLFYLQQGSEHDRDSAATLGQILASQVIQSFLSDRDNWRTFTAPESGIITLGDYNRNVIIVPSAKDQSITLDHFPSSGLIIYAPDWDTESDSTSVDIVGKVGVNHKTLPVIKGGVGIFLCSGQLVISCSLIGSSALSFATLKSLIVDELIVKSDLTLPASSILSGNIATKAVTTDKIANGAVTVDKIGTGAVTSEKIAVGAVTTDKISTHAVETDKVKDKAVTSEKLADQLAFVNRPFLPPNNFFLRKVTSVADYEILLSLEGVPYKGAIFSADGPISGWGIKLHISDADPNASNGIIYRIYNNTLYDVEVKDYTTGTSYTRILAWSFKDFYHLDGWRMD